MPRPCNATRPSQFAEFVLSLYMNQFRSSSPESSSPELRAKLMSQNLDRLYEAPLSGRRRRPISNESPPHRHRQYLRLLNGRAGRNYLQIRDIPPCRIHTSRHNTSEAENSYRSGINKNVSHPLRHHLDQSVLIFTPTLTTTWSRG